ncbi:MAG: hypothetical protein HPY45_08320 [Anaerolineae bacterium]|nr:hypothetical protein [Anaerolineae bacterium]
MANITTTTAAAFIPEIWAQKALEVLRSNVVLAKLVTKDTDVATFQVGDVLHIPYPGTFTAQDKSANTAVTLQTPSGGADLSVTLNKHKEVSFLIEDPARAQANQDLMDRYINSAVPAIAEAIENDLFALYAGLSGSVGTSGTDITAATIRSARKALGTTLSRALRIARTETLRAHREATRASYQANSDLVDGWIWHSALGERTCAACWAMHGTFHTLDERLDDHPNGRCAMVPATRSWAELGRKYGLDFGDVEETPPKITLGVDLFERLPVETQIKILGPAKYAAWEDGKFALGDVVGRKRSREWGTHRYEKSLVELLGAEKAKGYTRLALMGAAKNAGQYSADDLIRVAGLGLRELTHGELERVARHVANAGFSSTEMMRVRTSIRGQVWDGKKLEIGDTIPTDVGHYLKHVVVNQEWPDGTTLEDYKRSLEEVILDQDSDVFVSRYNDAWQIGFVRGSRDWRGSNGGDFIFVEYKVQYGYLVTGYQPEDVIIQLTKKRESFRWIRNKRFH